MITSCMRRFQTSAIYSDYVGQPLGEIDLPGSCLIAIIERDGDIIIAAPKEVLQPGDHVAVIGEPEDLTALVKG